MTDPLTNEIFGSSPNEKASIEPGGLASFLIEFENRPVQELTEEGLRFGCIEPVRVSVPIHGVNTPFIAVSDSDSADIIALALALGEISGVVDIAGPDGAGAFAVASANVGAAETITVTASAAPAFLGDTAPDGLVDLITLTVCQSDPQSGVCDNVPSQSVTLDIGANETSTFSVFVQGLGQEISLDPASNRIYVVFIDETGSIKGTTSVAVQTLQ